MPLVPSRPDFWLLRYLKTSLVLAPLTSDLAMIGNETVQAGRKEGRVSEIAQRLLVGKEIKTHLRSSVYGQGKLELRDKSEWG